jgi:hypothetical protein
VNGCVHSTAQHVYYRGSAQLQALLVGLHPQVRLYGITGSLVQQSVGQL